MPLFVLIAIFTAFWFEPASRPGPLPPGELPRRLLDVLGLLLLVPLAARGLGSWVAFRVARRGGATPAIRRTYAHGSRAVEILALGVFGAIIHEVGWPRVVESGFGLRETILLDEILILLPFLLALVAIWWGVYPAELALRPIRVRGLGRFMVLKARQSLGLVLPVALLFALGEDLIRRRWPDAARDVRVQIVGLATMGGFVLVLAPALVRLTWPTRPLPHGPLRDRLERLALRFRFRCTDILVWDTDHAVVNAGVTGALPWFRYVLLTDALIDLLDDRQVEAVFGHEVGHIAHRHLSFFGLFFLGSMGIMALAGEAIEGYLSSGIGWFTAGSDPTVATAYQVASLIGVGLYFLLVFGFLSRRFERQADVFGCRAVSCGRVGCPPHADLNGQPGPVLRPTELCPVGIRTFVNALTNVASFNGTALRARSWRHGSITRRIAFLEGLEGRPEAERRFQAGVSRLRLALALVLTSAVIAAIATQTPLPLAL